MMTYNNGIPNELLFLIVQQIPQPQRRTLYACSLVNKQFHSIVNPILWKEPNISTELSFQRLLKGLTWASHYRKQSLQQDVLLPPGQSIRRLTFVGTRQFTDQHLLRLLPHVTQLMSLKVSLRTQMTDISIQRLPRFCRHLTSLRLEFIPMTRSCFTALARHCPQLSKLCLRFCDINHRHILQPIAQHCHVNELMMVSCTMDQHTIVQDLIQFDRLTYLQLFDDLPNDSHIMTPLLLAASSSSNTIPWPVLKNIWLHCLIGIDTILWLSFIKTHPTLQDIKIHNAMLDDDFIMEPMDSNLHHHQLKRIRLTGPYNITVHGICQLIRYTPPSLESIHFPHRCLIGPIHFTQLPSPPLVDSRSGQVTLDATSINTIRSMTTITNNSILA